MLLEVVFVVGVYFGFRLFERHEKKQASKMLIVRERSKLQYSGGKEIAPKEVEPRKLAENANTQEIDFVKKNKKAEHYIKVSAAHLGLATIRQFIYPPIAPLYLGFFIYNVSSTYFSISDINFILINWLKIIS